MFPSASSSPAPCISHASVPFGERRIWAARLPSSVRIVGCNARTRASAAAKTSSTRAPSRTIASPAW